MNLVLFIIVEHGSFSHYYLENLLLVASDFLLSKLALMVLLIASKLVLWPTFTHKFLGWMMVILFLPL